MADDLLDVQDEIFTGSGGSELPRDFKMPTQDELLEIIDKMAGLDEDSKQELRDSVIGGQKFRDAASSFAGPVTENVKSTSQEVILLFSMISIVFLVIVLIFGSAFSAMNTKKKLKSAKKLMNMISMYKPEFKELLIEKIESRVSEEKIKIVRTVICIISAAIFLLVFVFFGYKLYKSLVERERRREEKKRQKLQKKKK